MKQELPFDLSVVTVCRNAISCIPRCIASVKPLYRSSLRIEHLVVDGDSGDGSVAYLKHALQHGFITRLVSEPDSGIYHAMNKAIQLARGKVIVFINADDEICPAAVPACCAPVLSGRFQYAVASALCINGNIRKILHPRPEMTLWRQPYCHQAMYCSRRLLVEMKGFDAERFPIGADTDLMRRLYVAHVPCAVVPVVAAHFYAGGISSRPETSIDVYELMLKFADACSVEIRRRPSLASTVIKHMRRYANKKMMLSKSPALEPGEVARLVDFVRNVVQGLSPTQRFILQHRMRLQGCWYAMKKHCTSGRSRQASWLNQTISTLFADNI